MSSVRAHLTNLVSSCPQAPADPQGGREQGRRQGEEEEGEGGLQDWARGLLASMGTGERRRSWEPTSRGLISLNPRRPPSERESPIHAPTAPVGRPELGAQLPCAQSQGGIPARLGAQCQAGMQGGAGAQARMGAAEGPRGRARLGSRCNRQAGAGHRSSPSRRPQPTGPRHPQGSLLRGQLPPFLDGFFQNSEQVVVQVMGTVSDMLHRLGAHGAGAQSLRVAINARSFFDDVSAPGWRQCAPPVLTPGPQRPGTPAPSSWAGETPGRYLGVQLGHLGRAGPSGRQVALGPFSTRLDPRQPSPLQPRGPHLPDLSRVHKDCFPSLGN